MLVPIMEIDAAKYAFISNQILHEGSFLEIMYKKADYLDKPPLLFWSSALSIAIFGVNSFAYKLPSVLALLGTIYITYRLSKLYYKKPTALFSAMVVGSCQSFFIMSNDCRTDNLLIVFSLLAIWKIAAYIENKKKIDFIIGFLSIGLSMLAKGPLGLVFSFFSVAALLLFQKNYKKMSVFWLIGLPIIAAVLFPMCLGLYHQHGWEGIRFYFWTQSFGRITGESIWDNQPDPFFLAHTFLWSFLPFTFLFISGVIFFFKKNSVIKSIDYACLSGVFLTMFVLSQSRYQLSHYIYIVSPLAAILCTQFVLERLPINKIRIFYVIQNILLLILLSFSFGMVCFFMGTFPKMNLILFPVLSLLLWLVKKIFPLRQRILLFSIVAFLGINFQLNTLFYPRLLTYQSSSQAAFFIKKNNIPVQKIINYNLSENALSFYSNRIIPDYSPIHSLKKKEVTFVYTDKIGLDKIKKQGFSLEILKTFEHFHVTKITWTFFNPKTRKNAVSKRFFIKIKNNCLF